MNSEPWMKEFGRVELITQFGIEMFHSRIIVTAFASVIFCNITNAEPVATPLPDDVVAKQIVKECRDNYRRMAGKCACYDDRKGRGLVKCGEGSVDRRRKNQGFLGLFCTPADVDQEDIRRFRGGDRSMINARCGKTLRLYAPRRKIALQTERQLLWNR